MRKRVLGLILGGGVFAASALWSFQAKAPDTDGLFREIAGRYQFMREGIPVVLTMYVEDGRLMVDEPRFPHARMEPAEAGRLEFNVEHENGLYRFRFIRNGEGRVADCLWSTGQNSYSGFKQGGVPVSSRFTPAQLREDLSLLWEVMRRLHPALYEYTPRKEFERLYRESDSALRKIMGPSEAYRVFAAFAGRIGCMHSSVWMPRGYWNDLRGRLFPARLIFVGEEVLVSGSYTDRMPLPRGAQILAINRVPIADILERVRSIISADAGSLPYKNFRLSFRFPLHYAIFYGFPEVFSVAFKMPGEEGERTAEIQPVPTEKVWKNMIVPRALALDIRNAEKAAVLTIPHFVYYRNRDEFTRFIDDAFDRIDREGIPNLVIDLRGNNGGDPFSAAHLFAYLAREPVPYFAEPYGRYAALAEPIPLLEKSFAGKQYYLIDGGCGSTTGHLCGLLKYHKLGTFIGETTGATFRCHDAHNSFLLKHTRFQAGVATGTFASAVQGLEPDLGIRPDFVVPPTAGDLAAGRDTILEYALRLIQNRDTPAPPPSHTR